MHLLIGILTALLGREKTGRARRFRCPCRTRCSTCAGSSCATSSAWSESATSRSTRSTPNGTFGDAVPRGGNAGGGGQPGWVLKCKGWETDPNAYIYFTIQEQNWERTCEAIGKPEWVDDSGLRHREALANRTSSSIFDDIEKWLADKTKYEAVDILRKFEVPCAPVSQHEGDRLRPRAARRAAAWSRSTTRSAART